MNLKKLILVNLISGAVAISTSAARSPSSANLPTNAFRVQSGRVHAVGDPESTMYYRNQDALQTACNRASDLASEKARGACSIYFPFCKVAEDNKTWSQVNHGKADCNYEATAVGERVLQESGYAQPCHDGPFSGRQNLERTSEAVRVALDNTLYHYGREGSGTPMSIQHGPIEAGGGCIVTARTTENRNN